MKFTRAIALLLVLAMILLSAAGCSTTDSTDTADAETESTAETESVAETESAESTMAETSETSVEEDSAEESSEAQETVEVEESVYTLPLVEETETLTYYFYMNSNYYAYWDDLENDIEFFKLAEAATNVHVDYTVFGSSSADQYSVMLASQDYCDMIDNIYNYPGGYGQALADNFVIDLQGYLEEFMPNYYAALKRNSDYEKNTKLDTGEIAVVWGLVDDSRGSYPAEYGPLVRLDWLEECGYTTDDLVTYDDWYEVLTAFKANYGAGIWLPSSICTLCGLFSSGYDVTILTSSQQSTASWMLDDSGSVTYGATTDEAKEFLKMCNQWYNEGLISSDFISILNPYAPAQDVIGNGDYGMLFCIKDIIVNYTQYSEDPDFQLYPIAAPVLEEGQTNTIGYETTLIQKQNTGVNADSDKLELACQWLDFWFSEEGIMIANYGEEGVTYTVEEDGTISYTDIMLNDADGNSLDTMLRIRARNQGSYMNIWYKTIDYMDEITQKTMEVWGSNTDQSGNYPSSVTMTTEETDEYNLIMSDILTYTESSLQSFVLGVMDIDSEWDAYVEQIESMNISDAQVLKQAAYDRYLQR